MNLFVVSTLSCNPEEFKTMVKQLEGECPEIVSEYEIASEC
jgi:hypothetical protein